MEQLIIILILIVVGYVAGSYAEAKHYRAINHWEQLLLSLPVVTTKVLNDPKQEIEQAVQGKDSGKASPAKSEVNKENEEDVKAE